MNVYFCCHFLSFCHYVWQLCDPLDKLGLVSEVVSNERFWTFFTVLLIKPVTEIYIIFINSQKHGIAYMFRSMSHPVYFTNSKVRPEVRYPDSQWISPQVPTRFFYAAGPKLLDNPTHQQSLCLSVLLDSTLVSARCLAPAGRQAAQTSRSAEII
jgi:hypothetical protein